MIVISDKADKLRQKAHKLATKGCDSEAQDALDDAHKIEAKVLSAAAQKAQKKAKPVKRAKLVARPTTRRKV
jgi:hypothetical protein